MELGESLEETARRETLEEVGLHCNTLTLFNVYSGPAQYYRYPHGDEVYNVSVTYLCHDFSGTLSVDPAEGRKACFFAINEIPKHISPPIQPIIDEVRSRYTELITRG